MILYNVDVTDIGLRSRKDLLLLDFGINVISIFFVFLSGHFAFRLGGSAARPGVLPNKAGFSCVQWVNVPTL